MSTKTLLDRLVPRASSGWNRSTGSRSLLATIQEGQDFLVNTLGDKRLWCGSDNRGWPPYLKTTAGVFTYEVKGANLSSGSITLPLNGTNYTVLADTVKRVFIDVTTGGYDDIIPYIGQPAYYSDLNPYSMATERLRIGIVAVDSMPAMGPANPTVTFPFDPGTTDNKYFIDFHWRAPRLISESIPLVVPTEFERALEEYAIGYMQESENGDPSKFTEKFETFWKPMFFKKFVGTAKIKNNKVVPRFF